MYNYDINVVQQWSRDRRHQIMRSFGDSRADGALLRAVMGQLMKRLSNHFVGWGKYLQTDANYRRPLGQTSESR